MKIKTPAPGCSGAGPGMKGFINAKIIIMKVKDYLSKNVPALDLLNYLCFLGLSLTTLYTANSVAISKLAPVMGEYARFAPALALAIGLGVMSIFDMDLRKNFVTACQVFTAEDWRQARASLKAIAVFFLFIAITRLALSMCATFISGAFMADEVTEDADIEGLEKMAFEKERTKQVLATELNIQVEKTRDEAERRAIAIEAAAIDAGGSRRAKLWRGGNSWIRVADSPEIVSWRNGIAAAQREAQRIRNEAEKTAQTLIATGATALHNEQDDAVFSAVVGAKVKQVEKAESKEWMMRLALWVADFVMGVFAVLSSIALAGILRHRPDYVLFREETSASAIGREFFLSIWRIMKSYGVWVVSWLDSRAENVVDSIGATVTIAGRTVAMQRRNENATGAQRQEENGDVEENVAAQEDIANGVSRDYNLIAEALRKAQSNVRAYQSNLNSGRGNPDTNRRGLEKWQARVNELERQLQDYSN